MQKCILKWLVSVSESVSAFSNYPLELANTEVFRLVDRDYVAHVQ